MKKYNAVCWFIICILAASCSYSNSAPNISSEAARILRTSPPIPNHSFRSRWEMVEQSISDNNSLSIIVYAMKLTGQNTVLISSVVSGNDGQNQPNFTILLRDTIGDADLLSKNDLASLGNVSFRVMEFEARNIGASEIYLVAGQNRNAAHTIRQIAKFVEPPEDPAVFGGRTYKIGTGQTFEQDGYKISFVGWVPLPSSVASATVGSSGSVAIIDNATLRIENLSNGKIRYLYIQFLSNGETSSELIQ